MTGEELVQRIRETWARATALAPSCVRPGVQRFRTLEEAQAARRDEVREHVQRLRRERLAG